MEPLGQPAGVPTCYRHPDRETYVRCGRCDRPICPDCMISAAVGFQCPECVRAANRGVREARTSFGGRVSEDPGLASRVIIAVTAAVYVAQLALGDTFTGRLTLIGLAFSPTQGELVGVAAGQWWRLLSAAFLHGSVLHLLLNMYAVYLFGPPLEAALGRGRFVALYLLAALGGSAASFLFSAPNGQSLGASGAVFGLLGAFLVVSKRLGRDASMVYGLLGINLLLGFVLARIDWRAHLGGLVAGSLVAAVLVLAPRARRTPVQLGGCAAVLALEVLLVIGRSMALAG